VKERRGGRWLGALAGLAGLTAGAVGAALLLRRRGATEKSKSIYPEYNRRDTDRWARPGMPVTFRVAEVLPSGRVMLEEFNGDHAEPEFEPIR
jgi:hypothetical protein